MSGLLRSVSILPLLAAFFTAGIASSSTLPVQQGAQTLLNYNLGAQDISANCSRELGHAKARLKAIALTKSPHTFQNTALALENALADLNDNLAFEQLAASVGTEKSVRDASNACQNQLSEFFSDFSSSPQLYRELSAASNSGTAKSAYDRKVLKLYLTAFIRAGAALSPEKRKKFVALSNELAALQTKFQSNLAEDKPAITATLVDLDGVPKDIVASFRTDGDKYIVPVDESIYTSFMANAKNASARRKFYYAYNNRGGLKNVDLLQVAIRTRDKLAHLMGYPSWAAYVLADRMASSPARVYAFLEGLDNRLLPRAARELALLGTIKARDTGVATASILPWDYAFYDNMLRKSQYAVDQDAVRQYFPVQHTVDAVLAIYSKVLGVRYARIQPTHAWAPDVVEYSVTDSASGRFIGTFYLDLFPRDGKFKHFENSVVLPVRQLQRGFRAPVSVIIGNWPKPGASGPALLSHADVQTFFHEFGHCMAATLATAPYETLSSGFRQDFVEAPSQMLENWVWDTGILKRLSSNAGTHKPLPDQLIARMIRARYVDDAIFNTRQVALSMIDMDYHSSGPSVDTTAVWHHVYTKTTMTRLPDGIHPQAGFDHLMSGYDAGYYSYLWSKVYAQDMFTVFASAGLESSIAGKRYRETILEPARTYEPDVLVTRFLGRKMNPAAFYKEFETSAGRTSAKAAVRSKSVSSLIVRRS